MITTCESVVAAVCCIAAVDVYGIVFDASDEDRHGHESHLSRLRSPDVPVACPLVASDLPHVFPAPLQPLSSPITGFAFNIYNNIWDTNFIMWYPYSDNDADFRARFYIDVWCVHCLYFHDTVGLYSTVYLKYCVCLYVFIMVISFLYVSLNELSNFVFFCVFHLHYIVRTWKWLLRMCIATLTLPVWSTWLFHEPCMLQFEMNVKAYQLSITVIFHSDVPDQYVVRNWIQSSPQCNKCQNYLRFLHRVDTYFTVVVNVVV